MGGPEPLVSGINCQPQSVYDDFLNTKLLYHKDGGVMFYHMVQSFPKGAAVDPRQAHEAARRLAEYFDGCEVLVCTHVRADPGIDAAQRCDLSGDGSAGL